MQTKSYIIENLGCANCAAKMEAKFNAMPAVQEAVLTFATRQLRLTADDPDALIPELEKIARSIEGNVSIRPKESAAVHSHHGHCGCGHHSHEHCECGHHHSHEHCECGHHHDHSHCQCDHEHDHHEHEHEHHHSGSDLPMILAGAALFVLGLALEKLAFPWVK